MSFCVFANFVGSLPAAAPEKEKERESGRIDRARYTERGRQKGRRPVLCGRFTVQSRLPQLEAGCLHRPHRVGCCCCGIQFPHLVTDNDSNGVTSATRGESLAHPVAGQSLFNLWVQPANCGKCKCSSSTGSSSNCSHCHLKRCLCLPFVCVP